GMRAHRAMAELAWRSTVMRRVFAWPLFGGPRFARRVAGRGGFARMRRAPLAAAALAGCRALDPLARGRFVLLAFRRRRQQQRLVALGDARERGGDLDRRHVVLLLVLLDQLLELAEIALRQHVADALLELADAHVVDHLDRRQLHLLDRLPGGALDRVQHATFARADEQDRLAAAPGAARAADAVHVAFGVVRDVVVQHVADPFHVEAAGGD